MRRRQSTNTRSDPELSVVRVQFLEREKEMSEELLLHTLRMDNERSESAARSREIETRIQQRDALFKAQEEFWKLTNEVMRFTAAHKAADKRSEQAAAVVARSGLVTNVLDSVHDGEGMDMTYAVQHTPTTQ